MFNINYFAVLTAAVANFALGGVWYQLLFRKPVYSELAAKVSIKDLSIAFVRGLIMVWALAVLMARTGVHSWLGAMELAVLLWFGLMATAQISEKIFGGRSWTLYLINTGYALAMLIVAGTILSFWM